MVRYQDDNNPIGGITHREIRKVNEWVRFNIKPVEKKGYSSLLVFSCFFKFLWHTERDSLIILNPEMAVGHLEWK